VGRQRNEGALSSGRRTPSLGRAEENQARLQNRGGSADFVCLLASHLLLPPGLITEGGKAGLESQSNAEMTVGERLAIDHSCLDSKLI